MAPGGRSGLAVTPGPQVYPVACWRHWHLLPLVKGGATPRVKTHLAFSLQPSWLPFAWREGVVPIMRTTSHSLGQAAVFWNAPPTGSDDEIICSKQYIREADLQR